MSIKQKIKFLLESEKLTKKTLALLIAVLFVWSFVVVVLAKEGIDSVVEGYQLRKERLSRENGLPRPASEESGRKNIFETVGETLGFLPKSEVVEVAEVTEEPAPIVEFTPEEIAILIQIPNDITGAEEDIIKIADLISEALIEIIAIADKSDMADNIVNQIFTDYPDISEVLSVADVRGPVLETINAYFLSESFKTFVDTELQKMLKDNISDLIGTGSTPEEFQASVSERLPVVLMDNLPIILSKPEIFNALTNEIYNTLNNLPVFDISATARVVSNISGDITYNFNCTNDGDIEKTVGPTGATSTSISGLCYYHGPGTYTIGVNAAKDSSNAIGFATIEVTESSLTITPVNQAPIADAGPSQIVQEGSSVTLNGANSVDPEGGSMTYSWSQTSGPSVSFSTNSAVTSFAAPILGKEEVSVSLAFQLTVTDNKGDSSAHSTGVTVIKDTPPGPSGEPRRYFAVVITGSSLGKVDYLNRIMGGNLSNYTANKTRDYIEDDFTSSNFGNDILGNATELAAESARSAFTVPAAACVYREGALLDPLLGLMTRTIEGCGECKKPWHKFTRCGCFCEAYKSYIWDPESRKCGCGV